MNVERIAASEMSSFLERFSRGHRGWLTKVGRFDPTRRGEVDSRERPLEGILSDTGGAGVLVFLDDDPRPVAYDVRGAEEIWRESTRGGVQLEISSEDGSTTILECHPAAPPPRERTDS